ncbi:MAG: hypothetical protein BWY59_00315 [Verrucomicrobia bacterium ADurb.Bin345]|nr:MAG: hypothetical protein BWY59_00315 [Verrucomicrobia bacterium ADurb.Bin345]
MSKFFFWVGVAMLVDAAIDLWGLNFWQRLVPSVNVRKIALSEALIGLLLLTAYFVSRL